MKKCLFITCLVLLFCGTVFAEEIRETPNLLNYQGALIDEGGNLLPDGSTNIKFKIINSAGSVLYEEEQSLEIVKGSVSAMVGNGGTGISAEILDPTNPIYLQVEVAGHNPYDPMEIVSVPYSKWADTALRLPIGAITSEMIGKGVITKENLNDELLSAIFPGGIPKNLLPSDTVYSNDFESFRNSIQSVNGAGKVGVVNGFMYSGSQTVQGVLKDLDVAIKKRQEEVDWAKADYNAKITSETNARISSITSEANTRISEDSILRGLIASEAGIRNVADGSLQTGLTNEANARVASDGSLQNQISSHAGAVLAHGATSDVVGVDDRQTLRNKILVAPLITSGANDSVNAPFDISVSEGVAVDGNLTVTGKIKSNNNSAVPSSNNDITSGGQAKAWVKFHVDNNGPTYTVNVLDSYNVDNVVSDNVNSVARINFKRSFANPHYVVTGSVHYKNTATQGDLMGVSNDQDVNGVSVYAVNTTGNVRLGDETFYVVFYGTLAD